MTFKPFDTDAHTVRRDFASWRLALLELIVTVTYTIGLLYLVPKVVGEFRQAQPPIQQHVDIQQTVMTSQE